MSICIPDNTDWSCTGWTEAQLTDAKYGEDAALFEKSETFAWMLLAALTAYQIGTCPITVRPCAARCAPAGALSYGSVWPSATIGRLNPYISGGVWYNACAHGAAHCECTALPEVRLQGPVGGVVEVRVDGEVVPATAYRAVGERLIRIDGGTWPLCRDWTQSDEDGFTVSYYRGAAPNIMTRAAAGALAYEFYKGCKGEECRLPNNVIRASGGGLSYDMDILDISEGASIPEVVAVVRVYNPYGLKSRPTVASPDAYAMG